MVTYLVAITVSSLAGFLCDKAGDKKSKYYFFISLIPFIVLFLISALRYKVGRDYTDTYVYTFNKILQGSQNIRADLGFLLLNKIIIWFDGSAQWFFVLTSFIINFFVSKSIFKQSKNKMLSFFIYICGTFFFFSLNGIRQAIAMSFFYYSFRYVKEKKLYKYIICNLCGFLFHNSAILFLPLYFILSKNFSKKIKAFILVIVIILSNVIVPIIINMLISTKYGMYLTNGAYEALSTFNLSTFINIFIWLAYELGIKKKDDMDNIYSNCHFIGILVSLFLTRIPLAIRIFVSFRYVEFLSVPNLIDKIALKRKYKFLIILGIMMVYFMYFIYGVYIQNGNTVLPYRTVLFK